MRRFLCVLMTGGLLAGLIGVTTMNPVGAQTGDLAAFCAARIEINGAESKKENLAGLDKLVSVAPAEVAQPMTQLRDEFEKKGFRAYESETVAVLDAFVYDNCPGSKVALTAIDYEFQDVPATLEPGTTNFKMTNDAPKEDHEMVFVRLTAAGEKVAIEKLLALPEKKQAKLLDFSSATGMFASAGQTAYTIADLQPGTYVYACFLPVGGKKKGAPHYTQGMYGSFTVS